MGSVIQTFYYVLHGKAWVCSRVSIQCIQIPGWTGPWSWPMLLTSGTCQMLGMSSQLPVWFCGPKRQRLSVLNGCSAYFETQAGVMATTMCRLLLNEVPCQIKDAMSLCKSRADGGIPQCFRPPEALYVWHI